MPPKYNNNIGGRGGGGSMQNNNNNYGMKRNDNNNNNNGYSAPQQQHNNVMQQQQVAQQQQMLQQQQQQQQLQQQQQQQQIAQQQQQQQQPGSSPCGDSFGMLGLVNDKTETAEAQSKAFLVRGFDLAQLGLSLVDPSQLYPTFASPWADGPSLLVPEYRVPPCYKVEVGRITYNTFQKFSEPTCFYVFYSMPKDLLQVAAAKELITRGYAYHTVLKYWVKPDPTKAGGWLAFNPEKWAVEPLNQMVREEDLMRSVPTAGQQPSAAAPATPTSGAPQQATA